MKHKDYCGEAKSKLSIVFSFPLPSVFFSSGFGESRTEWNQMVLMYKSKSRINRLNYCWYCWAARDRSIEFDRRMKNQNGRRRKQEKKERSQIHSNALSISIKMLRIVFDWNEQSKLANWINRTIGFDSIVFSKRSNWKRAIDTIVNCRTKRTLKRLHIYGRFIII